MGNYTIGLLEYAEDATPHPSDGGEGKSSSDDPIKHRGLVWNA